MTEFDLDAVAAEEARERYTFRSGGRQFSVPHVSDLMLGQQYAIDAGQYVPTFRAVAQFGPDDPGFAEGEREVSAGDLLASMLLEKRPRQIAPLVAAWLAHAGLKPGESKASST